MAGTLVDFGRFRGIHTVQPDREFGLLWCCNMDRIPVRDLGDCAGDCADRFASERGSCVEKDCQSCKQAEGAKAFHGECF